CVTHVLMRACGVTSALAGGLALVLLSPPRQPHDAGPEVRGHSCVEFGGVSHHWSVRISDHLEDALRPLSCAYVDNGYMESAATPVRCREALEHSRLGSVLGTCRPQLSDAAGAQLKDRLHAQPVSSPASQTRNPAASFEAVNVIHRADK